ncbi:uncharacterized protein LOC142577978 [Dermacentor variabilis]|uniref:uncharacterized protein LOC142577978 n=1 Tax=Dermacentor variabilis TaxID=34621 RepID=UPI003F5B8545
MILMYETMSISFYIIALVCLRSVLHVITSGLTHEGTHIDNHQAHFDHQDIYKAFRYATNYWLYGFNYDSPHTKGKRCVYLRKESLTKEQMNYTSNFIKKGRWGSIQYYGTFFSTPGISKDGTVTRKHYNSIKVRTNPGVWIEMNYTLIYTNYEGCLLVRIPAMLEGSGCMVLLTSAVVRRGLRGVCKTIYEETCGKHHQFYPIYDKSCRKNPIHTRTSRGRAE